MRVSCFLLFYFLCSLFLILAKCSSVFAQESLNWDRGPIELDDQFPLALLHSNFSVASPRVLECGQTRFRSTFAWTNTHNRKRRGFVVDAEARTFNLSLSHGVSRRLELGAVLPIVWRGGGVLDSLIYKWHNFFGMSQGPRDDAGVENNEYQIRGTNNDGSDFDLSRTGTAFGDLRLGGKYLLTEGSSSLPAVSLSTSIQLPTGASGYGADKPDVVLGLLASKRWGGISLYSGAGYTFVGDTKSENLEFARHRVAGFLHGECRLGERISLLLGLHASSKLVEGVLRFPDYELYLDMGGKISLSDSTLLEILVRENPAPDHGTADVTFFLGLDSKFTLPGV